MIDRTKFSIEQKRLQLIRGNKVNYGFHLLFRSGKLPYTSVHVSRVVVMALNERYKNLSITVCDGYFRLDNYRIESHLSLSELSPLEVESLWYHWMLFLTICKEYRKLWNVR